MTLNMFIMGLLYSIFTLYFFICSLAWKKYLKENYPDFWTPLILLEAPERAWHNTFQPFRLFVFPTKQMRDNPEYSKLIDDTKFIKQKRLLIINFCWLGVIIVLFIITVAMGFRMN